jgi:predicted Holliday junction resolvase-like endonuclease
VTIGLTALSILLLILLFKSNLRYHKLKKQSKKLLSQKKQSEIRVGQIAEHFVPLLKEFKYNRKQARFLASPIDFIIFEEDEIIFMEVKTGKSQLNKNQRRIRGQVKEKKVRWEVLRINGEK